jgi:hypothetical protein
MKALKINNLYPEKQMVKLSEVQKWKRCSTCLLGFGCWELIHVIFLILRQIKLLVKLSKFTK